MKLELVEPMRVVDWDRPIKMLLKVREHGIEHGPLRDSIKDVGNSAGYMRNFSITWTYPLLLKFEVGKPHHPEGGSKVSQMK